MDKPTLKKTMIQGYCFALTTKEFLNNYLILVTAWGTIMGKPVLDDELENSEVLNIVDEKLTNQGMLKFISTMQTEIGNNYREDYKVTFPLPENDGYMFLKDVTIKNLNATYNFPFLTVFYDQIIAVTFGNLNT